MANSARCFFAGVLLSCTFLATQVASAQQNSPVEDPKTDAEIVDSWDRLIYVPYRELQKVFENQSASAVIPYDEYLELLKRYMQTQESGAASPDAVITRTDFQATVEKDIVRIQARLQITVLKSTGWAGLPLDFGAAAVGQVTADDDSKTILTGVAQGRYELLLNGEGEHIVTIELLATISTSPESRSFSLNCPAVGISELTLTIPEPDQTVEVSPLQVLLPVEGSNDSRTVTKASLGSTNQFSVSWNPKASSKPVMDLLTTVSNQTHIRIDVGLIQTKTVLNYEVLRGSLQEVNIVVPSDAKIIDVVSANGRIQSWEPTPVGDTHQRIRVELLTPVTDRFQVEIQTERSPEGDTYQLIGKSSEGRLQGIHADSVVRESGQIRLTTDPSLTAVVRTQTGVNRIDSGSERKGADNATHAWEFSGATGVLVVQTKPIEPRLTVDSSTRLMFGDDELSLTTKLVYTVERAGVFQLQLRFPETLVIDSVRADGMSEFNVDRESGQLTLALTQKRLGVITVDVQAHQSFDSAEENQETTLPSIAPVGVERETGRLDVLAPQFLDVITVEDKVSNLFPARDVPVRASGRAQVVSSWNFTQRPFELVVKSSPRPAQLSGSVATTAEVKPDIVSITSTLQFEIRNAGVDTFRVAVPEAIADDVRFRSVNPLHVIQQRNKAAEAVDGWVTWTLVLQDEVTGTVQLAAEWEVSVGELDDDTKEQTLTLEPVRILTPFSEEQGDRRRVTLTQTQGELRLLRHESLSISAQGEGETMEQIDVRELNLMAQDGYLAFRYFAQPVSATVTIRKHEVHEVVATVVSRAAVEIVTDQQRLASYRVRLLVTSSERQRLRIDLPEGAELQAPLLNDRRTTFEPATDVEVSPQDGFAAYYVNISRSGTSDESFLLSFQFRYPITRQDVFPYEKRGGVQKLLLPVVGDSAGGTVMQEIRVAVWSPDQIAQFGKPEGWTVLSQRTWSTLRPLGADSGSKQDLLKDWLGVSSTTSDFATQGNVAVYRALGRQTVLEIPWWNRPFLVIVISGTLAFVGLILRRTSWENRITLVVLVAMAVMLWCLQDSTATLQLVSAASIGMAVVAAIWIIGFVSGNGNGRSGSSNHGGPGNSPPDPPESESPNDSDPKPGQPTPASVPNAAIVTPAPGVADMMNDLMGGK